MLALIVLAPERGCGLPPLALLEPLLGAPLLARSVAAALPVDEAVTGVLAVPGALAERVRAEVLERFGLDEVDHIVDAGVDRRSALTAALEALPAEVDHVVVQEGARVLVPGGLVERVVAAARQRGGSAIPVIASRGLVRTDAGGHVARVDDAAGLKTLQGPACYRVDQLRAALASQQEFESELELLLAAGGVVTPVEGDDDNFLLCRDADVSRAVEVFARRAVDFAFIYPRDLLPDDPLARALSTALDP